MELSDHFEKFMPFKKDLQELLKKYGLKPNKFLGQNFLIDRAVLKKIIEAADLSKADTVLEIGPGLGILTEELAKNAGGVIAVEKDKKMAEIVRNVLNDRNVRNVEIVERDILKTDISRLLFCHPEARESGPKDLRRMPVMDSHPREILHRRMAVQNDKHLDYKVVANIPYYLTSRLIRKFLESENPPAEMILMLQKEVAQRICARPPKMSLLAVATQFYAIAKICAIVSKKSFWPQPKVDSAIIRIAPYPSTGSGHSLLPEQSDQGERNRRLFFEVVKAGFTHPRKQLINNLTHSLKINRFQIATALKKIGLAPQQRAESLNVNDWIRLANVLNLGDSGDVTRRQSRQNLPDSKNSHSS